MTLRPPKKPFLTLDANLVQDDLPLEVVPKIFVGSIHSAFNLDMLQCHGITHILNASRLPVTFPKQFTYLSVEIRDKGESNILSCIPTSNIFIEASLEAGGVLVHCFGGKSRSPAFIAAYLMSSRNWSFDEAYNMIKQARPTVDINAGFERQLRAYGVAHYDVYVAQQLLLRARIRALLPLRGNEQLLNNPDVKASDRIVAILYERTVGSSAAPYLKHDSDPDKETSPEESLLHSLSSTGQKRSWVEEKSTSLYYPSEAKRSDDEDEGSMDIVNSNNNNSSSSASSGGHAGLSISFGHSHSTNDQEESAAIREIQRQQQQQQHHNSSNMSLLGSSGGVCHSDGSSHSISFRLDSTNNSTGSASEGLGSSLNNSKVPRGKRVNRSSRSIGTENDSKTPSCRLSRPGNNWVRVIPPLRGLEREFKCSWCNIALFSLANVIRVDLDVLPLLDIVKAEEKESYSRKHTPRLDSMGSPTGPMASAAAGGHGASFHRMNPPSVLGSFHANSSTSGGSNSSGDGLLHTGLTPRMTPRKDLAIGMPNSVSPRANALHFNMLGTSPPQNSNSSQDVEMDIDEDDGVNDIASPKYNYPLKSTRAPGARAFDFDIPIIPLNNSDLKSNSNEFKEGSSSGGGGNVSSPPLSSARGTGGNLSGRGSQPVGPLSARGGMTSSPKVSARHHFEGDSLYASDSKQQHSSSSANMSLAKAAVMNGSSSARGAAGAGHSLLHPNIASRPSSATSTSLYSYGAAGSAVYDDSPRIQIPAHRLQDSWNQQDKRPQSAEKRRWLARVNLLREGGDTKAAKMADDDDMASELGFGDDKYFHVEYLDWMGKDLFRLNNDVGDICCHNCHKAVGTYYWRPSVRLLNNNKLEAPLFKIHKNVVHQTDWVFDSTPQSTPRVEDPNHNL